MKNQHQNGYLKDTNTYTVTVEPNKTTKQAITNQEPTGKIVAYKVSENNDKVAGAVIKMQADEKITNKAGTKTFYNKGDIVATLTTDTTGKVEKDGLPLGRYLVYEESAPKRIFIKHRKIYSQFSL